MVAAQTRGIARQRRGEFPAWCEKVLSTTVLALMLSLCTTTGWAQTTFGSFVGTVRDPSGAVVAGCKITVTNLGTAAQRSTQTDASGNYEVLNLEPGRYETTMEAPGFASEKLANLQLLTRQTLRVDRTLTVASQVQQVEVSEAVGAPINTEASNIAETKSGRELVDLPVAIGSRGLGSTSAFTTLTTQPGVEIDNSGKISIAGEKPGMTSASIDGISSVNPKAQGPATELFPSFDTLRST